jgi:putative PIN family toxin of toxin-antitoxin system
MLRVVVDTNLFVRGLLKGPITAPLIQAWKEGRFTLVTAEKLIAELLTVLARPKFSPLITRDDVRELGELIYERAEIVEPALHLELCRDPKDNVFLEVAIAGNASYLVTGDSDLKDDPSLKDKMREAYGLHIMGVTEFLIFLASTEQATA